MGRFTQAFRIPKPIELEKRGEPVFVAIPQLGQKKEPAEGANCIFLLLNAYFCHTMIELASSPRKNLTSCTRTPMPRRTETKTKRQFLAYDEMSRYASSVNHDDLKQMRTNALELYEKNFDGIFYLSSPLRMRLTVLGLVIFST